jgi:uncharacterized membrane protein
MSSLRKLVLLMLTVLPVLHIAIFFIIVFGSVISREQAALLQERFIYLMIAHVGVMLLLTALFGYYCVLLYRDSTLDLAKKVIWIAAFLFTGPFGMLTFWYVIVWNRPPEPAVPSRA